MFRLYARQILSVLLAGLLLLQWLVTPAAADLFLYVDGVVGESTDPAYPDWIEAESYSLEASRPVPENFPQNSTAQLGDLVVAAETSLASPGIFEALLLGRSIPTVMLDLTQSFGVDPAVRRPVAQWELERALVTDFQTIVAADGQARDRYQFYFAEITYRYLSYDVSGKLLGQTEFSFDRVRGTESISTSGDGATPPSDIAAACRESTLAPHADFNGDSLIAGSDFLIWQRGFSMASAATLSEGDANGDGVVDQIDRVLWEARYGSGALPATYVPEPNGRVWTAAAIVALLRRRPRYFAWTPLVANVLIAGRWFRRLG